MRARHPAWTLARLRGLKEAGTRVRVSGSLLLDPKHLDHVGEHRATRWEVHPVMRIEAEQAPGEWADLDAVAGAVPAPRATPVPLLADRDCGNFATEAEAQAFFLAQGGPALDPHGLDGDGNGLACQGLP